MQDCQTKPFEADQLPTLVWPRGRVSMQPRGAMLRELEIRLADGRSLHPLHTAHWVDTPEALSLTGLMQGLSGEWPCVPFGVAHKNLPDHWTKSAGWEDPFAHGFGAHHDWDIHQTDDWIEARIDYPGDHPVQSLRRRVTPCKGGIALDLWVTPRRDCRLPMGLHPVFALPQTPGRMELVVHGATAVWSHPEAPCADPTPARDGAQSAGLDAIRSFHSGTLDFSRLPRNEQSETRLLALGCTGRIELRDTVTGITRFLGFDPDQFPFVMLWMSNFGRSATPWSGRHLALGIEPVRAAFDLGTSVSTQFNPLSACGQDTAFDLTAGSPFHTRYSITAAAGPLDSR